VTEKIPAAVSKINFDQFAAEVAIGDSELGFRADPTLPSDLTN
jgi:hypothetical protein